MSNHEGCNLVVPAAVVIGDRVKIMGFDTFKKWIVVAFFLRGDAKIEGDESECSG